MTAARKPRKSTAAPALRLDLQLRSRAAHVPSRARFLRWLHAALDGRVDTARPVEVTLRVTGPAEMRALNLAYRGRDYATNVLSFPFAEPGAVELPVRVLGDIVLCAQTVQREARIQGKTVEAHWAHLTVHGVLHLLGMDHEQPRAAARMEGAEIAVLATLGYPDPYHPEET